MDSTINDTKLQETSKFLFKLSLAIAIIVMFFVGTILGIKFMLASAEDKAKVKESLVPYILGCIVIFGAFSIWEIVVITGQSIFGGEHYREQLAEEGDFQYARVSINDMNGVERKNDEYQGAEGLQAILDEYFVKVQYTGGAPYTAYRLKDRYMQQLLNGDIQIVYYDLWDSEVYKKEYRLVNEQFASRFPQRAYELANSDIKW